jgi:hypothetical protein
VAWQSVTNTAHSWTTASATTPTWNGPAELQSPLRLSRVYPQALPQEDLPFIYRIQSEGAFLVATGNSILIRSSITEPIL